VVQWPVTVTEVSLEQLYSRPAKREFSAYSMRVQSAPAGGDEHWVLDIRQLHGQPQHGDKAALLKMFGAVMMAG
jgi:hypothetical protein